MADSDYGFQPSPFSQPAEPTGVPVVDQSIECTSSSETNAEALPNARDESQAVSSVRPMNDKERELAKQHGAWWLSELDTRLRRYIADPNDPDRARVLLIQLVEYKNAVLNGSAIAPQVDR